MSDPEERARERERRTYITAVREWQQGYGCTRDEAEAAVQSLGIVRQSVTDDQWNRALKRRSGRPTNPKATALQNIAVLAVYYETRGARPMHALVLAEAALPRGMTLSRSKKLQAVKEARAVLPKVRTAEAGDIGDGLVVAVATYSEAWREGRPEMDRKRVLHSYIQRHVGSPEHHLLAHALAAWGALGKHGPNPLARAVSAGRSPGRFPGRRILGTS